MFCDIGDTVRVTSADDLTLTVEGPFATAIEEQNIVLRAAQAMRAEFAGELTGGGQSIGAAIHLTKTLPVGAGIGGGSSDAAATIKALCRLWEIDIAMPSVARIAAKMGADVPACMAARPVLVEGIGDQISPMLDLSPLSIVLINPAVPVSTADVYRRCVPATLPVTAAERPASVELADLVAWLDVRRNDLTVAAIQVAPEIEQVLSFLRNQPNCVLARMSGSGATCFGLFNDGSGAAAAATAATVAWPLWWSRAARSYSGASP